MRVIILAGGFGERLSPLTKNKPKALLKIRGKSLIDYSIKKINEMKNISEIVIVSNNKFYNQFLNWRKTRKEKIEIINNGINSLKEIRSGLEDFLLGIKEKEDEEVLVLGGDVLFDCSLKKIQEKFRKENKNLAVFYNVYDLEKAKSLGVGEVRNNLLVGFEEKPAKPKTTICSTCAYFYKSETLKLIKEITKKNSRGNIGSILESLYNRVPIYAHIINERWIDINSKEDLERADPAYKNKRKFTVSIIIPCKEIDAFTMKCIKECLNLDYPDYEILILPDGLDKRKENSKVRIIPTGKVKPAVKRNLGMEKAKGEFFAFIDSDAYPKKDWLKNAIKYFEDEKIGIVGGPNLTPPKANIDEQISGHVLANYLVSGPASIRYRIGKNQFVKELPSCNYISRKEISPKYKEGLLTAEDSKFCFDVKRKGYKILYANEVIVYHHRRETIKKHIKQMFIYGRDIAWLAKEEFSFDMLFYSLLSLFVLGFLTGIVLSSFFPIIKIIFFSFVAVYFFLMFVTSICKSLMMTLYVMTIGITTHFAYGVGFLFGVFVKNKNELHVKS